MSAHHGPIAAAMRRPYSLRSIFYGGTTQFVSFGASPGTAFERTTAFSFSLWYARTGNPGVGTFGPTYLGRFQNTSPFRGWYIEIATNHLQFILRNNIVGPIEAFIAANIGAATLSDGRWHHVAGTYTGNSSTTGMELYFDGNLGTKITVTNTLGTNTIVPASGGTGKIGGGLTGFPTLNAYGFIDDVSIWNKALSLSEVRELRNNGWPGSLNAVSMAANLIRSWRMGDSATFPTIPEEQGSGDVGTMTNMVAGDISAVVAGL